MVSWFNIQIINLKAYASLGLIVKLRPRKKKNVSRPDFYKKESGRAGFFVIYYFLLHAFFTH